MLNAFHGTNELNSALQTHLTIAFRHQGPLHCVQYREDAEEENRQSPLFQRGSQICTSPYRLSMNDG